MLLNREHTALRAVAAGRAYSLDFKSTKFGGYHPGLRDETVQLFWAANFGIAKAQNVIVELY